MKKHVDLLVIGAGSGGLAAAKMSASYGANVVVVDKGPLGGTCVNEGCIPKKIMWNAASVAENYLYRHFYGFKNGDLTFDFKTLVEHRQQYIKSLNELYQQQLIKKNIAFIAGVASFQDSKTVSVNGELYSANHIIIATGCSPARLDIKGGELAIDSDGFFSLHEQPEKIAVVGSGYIAVELASIMNLLGSEIKLLLRYDKLLRHFDSSIGDSLSTIMAGQGIQVLTNHELIALERSKQGMLVMDFKDNKVVSDVDTVIFAVGREPRTKLLNLKAAAVKTDANGYITTDKRENTNIPHIYAIGDVTGKKQLTPVAIAAGRKLATRLFGGKDESWLDYNNIPTVIFSYPPAGSVGLSEQEAVKKYGRSQLTIYQTQFSSLFFSLGGHKIPTRMKLISLKKNGKVIGCHMVGTKCDEILQGFAVAIKMGATKEDFDATVAIHPTTAEELVTMTANDII